MPLLVTAMEATTQIEIFDLWDKVFIILNERGRETMLRGIFDRLEPYWISLFPSHNFYKHINYIYARRACHQMQATSFPLMFFGFGEVGPSALYFIATRI